MSSVPAISPLAPGFRLDRYELICPIAEGGMASVWIARQTGRHGFKKLVAVKTILPKYAEDQRFQEMFNDEARIASRIEHTNVAQILDVGEQHGITYLVMEYVDGDSLSRLHRALDKKASRIPLGVALRVLADVCGGLHAAHELRDDGGQLLGVVHRDVSPQNILVSTRGVAKLIDFGIAKARDRLAADTRADQLKGKLAYMAPEQALGGAIDRRADIWAIGAILYHLLAGRPPFEGDNDVQTVFLLAGGNPPPPLPSFVPRPVAAIVSRALSHASHERYATAAELQQAIEAAMAEVGVPTTTAAVAQFLDGHASDRVQRRKQAITLGLKAADERERFTAMMKSSVDASGLGSMTGAPAVPPLVEPGEKSAPSGTLGLATTTLPLRARARGVRLAVLGAGAGLAMAVLGVMAFTRGGSGIESAKTSTSRSAAGPSAASPDERTATAGISAAVGVGAGVVTGAESATSSSSVVAPPLPPPAASAAAAPPERPPATDTAAPASAPVATPTPAPAPRPRFVPRPHPKPRVNDGF